jgi:hypothetical protein
MILIKLPSVEIRFIPPYTLLLVICNSVKMGIRLCYKWEEPEAMVKVEQ